MQRITIIAALVVLIAVAGCAAPLDPRTIEIPANKLGDYWQVDFENSPRVRLPAHAGGDQMSKMRVRYAIDANGRARNIEILEFEGPRSNVQYMRKELEVTRFIPAPSNPERIPVIVEQERGFGIARTLEDFMNMLVPEGKKVESIQVLPERGPEED